jgi:hypothetical protein
MAKRTYNRLAQYRSGKMFYNVFSTTLATSSLTLLVEARPEGRNVFSPPRATSFWGTTCRRQEQGANRGRGPPPREGVSSQPCGGHPVLPSAFIGQAVQAFPGLVNFYRRFLPAAARFLRPPTDALVGGIKRPSPIVWTGAMRQSFYQAQAAVSTATCQVQPAVGARLGIMVDASATHVGAALQHQVSSSSPWLRPRKSTVFHF